jgi:methylated-DNA-[protein]-cysteine S-methyltransferase
MTFPQTLDERFREAAVADGLIDVGYDLVDSPLGALFVAVSDRGVCRLSYDAEPEAEEERLARLFGSRVLRAPRAVDDARRELDDYFEGRRREFGVPVDLRPVGGFHRTVLERLAQVPYGELTTYGALATEAGRPKAARAVGTVMNRNPIPIILPCHRVVGSTGKLVGYGGGLHRKEALLTLERGL